MNPQRRMKSVLYQFLKDGYSVFARCGNIFHVKKSNGDAINDIKNEISTSGVYSNCGEINCFLTVIMFGITNHQRYDGIPILDYHSFASYLSEFLSFRGDIDHPLDIHEGNEALRKSMQKSQDKILGTKSVIFTITLDGNDQPCKFIDVGSIMIMA